MSLLKAEDRIVSLAPVATELIHVLGLESSLVGITEICEYSGAGNISRLGAYSAISPEAVYNLHPTMVILTEGAENQASMFRSLGLKVFEIKTSSFLNFESSAINLAKELHVEGRLASLLEEKELEIKAMRTGLKNEKVLILFGDEGSHVSALSYYAIGQNTFYDDLISKLDMKNELSGEGYNLMSLEGVCETRPTCIVLASDENKEKNVRAIRNCHKDVKFKVVPKNPFLHPGIRYLEIVKSLSFCSGI